MLTKKKVAIIGLGKLGESLAQALSKKDVLNESQRDAIERAVDKLAAAIKKPGGKVLKNIIDGGFGNNKRGQSTVPE